MRMCTKGGMTLADRCQMKGNRSSNCWRSFQGLQILYPINKSKILCVSSHCFREGGFVSSVCGGDDGYNSGEQLSSSSLYIMDNIDVKFALQTVNTMLEGRGEG